MSLFIRRYAVGVLFAAFFALLGNAWAQDVASCRIFSVGTGHGSTTHEAPANNAFNYSVTEMIYAPWEIGAQPGIIRRIEFEYAHNVGMAQKNDVDIYMANISQSSFHSSLGWITTDLTLVYSGTLNCSGVGQWNTLQLNSDFNWAGGCLLVVVDDNSGSSDGDSFAWYSTESESNTVLRIASNETNYTLTGAGGSWVGNNPGILTTSRPNMRFCIDENCTRRTGVFAFSEDTVSFVAGSGDFPEPLIDTTSVFTSLQPYTGTVTYYASNESIASVDPATGEVTLTGEYGMVTIYATALFGDYCPAMAKYVVDVTDVCKRIGRSTNPLSRVPISTGNRYSYSQSIFTPSEIGCGGKINSIAFESQGENSIGRTVEIYMGETDVLSFSVADASGFVPSAELQLVYSGAWNITEGWQTFALQNAFTYSGLYNLVVAVKCVATGSSPSYFAYTSLPAYRTLYCYSDNYEPVPSAIASYAGDVSRLRGLPNTKICIDCCSIRPTFQFDDAESICYLGNDCPMPALVNTSPGLVYFTSSADSVATVSDNGAITPLAQGETTIMALLEMSGDTCPARSSYRLRVACPVSELSVVNDTICSAGLATLNASASDGSDVLWYDSVDAETPVHTGTDFTVAVDTTTVFFVAGYSETYGCVGSRVPVVANVFDVQYDSATLNITGYVDVTLYGYPPADGTSGISYSSADIPAWLTLNADGSFFGTPTAVGSGVFTITATNGDCTKTIEIRWTVEENILTCCDPDAFYLYNDGDPLPVRRDGDGFFYMNVCKGEPATFRVEPLAAGCAGYTYTWSLTSSTGNPLGEQTGDTFNYTFALAEGYNVTLTVSKPDPDACSLVIPIRVRVSGGFLVTVEPDNELCQDEPFSINVASVELQSQDWSYTVAVDTVLTDCGWQSSYADGSLHITPPSGFTGSGSYDVIIRDEYGCETHYDDIVNITVYPTVNNTDSVSDQCDTYTWSRTNRTYTESGTYISNMLTGHGCLDRDTLVLELNHSYDGAKDTAICPADFPFDWYGAHFIEPGTQVQHLYSIDGCDSVMALTVARLTQPALTLANPDNDGGCPGEDYIVHTYVSGGTAPYIYAWTGYTSIADSLYVAVDTCGNVRVEAVVTDAKGCADTAEISFDVIDNEKPTFLNPIAVTDALRPDSCRYLVPDLIAMVQPRDNCVIVSQVQTPPPNYELSGDTVAKVVVSDACGNEDSILVLVRAERTLTDTLRLPNIDCPLPAGGSYDLSIGVGGGVEPYAYSWNVTESGHSVSSIEPTLSIPSDGSCHNWSVAVTVTDRRGCSISENQSFSASDNVSPSADNGSENLLSTGLTCKYVVPDLTEWARSHAQDNCTASTELVVVEQTPAAGDTVSGWRDAYVVVADKCGNRSPQIQVRLAIPGDNSTYTISHDEYLTLSCPNSATGTFWVYNVHGGVAPYTYIFRDDTVTTTDTEHLFTGLSDGENDTLWIVDANGCSDISTMVDILSYEPMSLTFTSTGTVADGRNFKLCKDTVNEQTVTITASASGNEGEAAYSWHYNGSSDATITLLNPDSTAFYPVTVTDDNTHCAFTDSVKLTVNYPTVSIDEQFTCVDEGATSGNFRWHSSTINFGQSDIASGYVDGPSRSYRDANGCMSQEVLHLFIKHNSTAAVSFDTCDSYTWHGTLYSQTPTVATFDTVNAVGCDSTTTLNLTLRYSSSKIEDADVCDSLVLHRPGLLDTTFYESYLGYNFSTDNAVGCDSITTLNLIVHHRTDSTVTLSVCDSLSWHDSTYTVSTTTAAFDTINAVGCDSTATLNLTVRYGSSSVVDTSVCDSLVLQRPVGGDTTFTEGVSHFQFTVVNSVSCDSMVTLNLTVRYSSDSLYRDTVCDSLRWPAWDANASLFTESTSEPYPSSIYPTFNAAGCDSTVYLALVVKHSSVVVDTQNVCDSLIWTLNGTTYYESTNEPRVVLGGNGVGCDSLMSLNLTVRHSSDSTEVLSVCDSIVWHGAIYRETTDTVAFDTINAVACDSIVTLNLTVHYSDTVDVGSDTICADASREWHGVSYNASGTYLYVLDTLNSVGCDSVESFTLVVHDTNHVYVYDTCAYRELPWSYGDRSYYDRVEDDIFELLNRYGCDSTVHYYLQPVWKCEEFIQFPSVVTPNGDGINDRFVITNLLEGGCFVWNHLSIFNRWGFLVFDRENIQRDEDFWDPVDMPDGTYFFRFDGYSFEEKVERRGSFEIIRKP